MVKLSKEDVLFLHDWQLQMCGGDVGIREPGTFDLLCEAPYQTMFGADLYPTVFEKAAKLVEGFATHQVFFDGNKRTGLSAMVALLKANGYELVMTNSTAYHFVLSLANNQYSDLQEIADMIRKSTTKMPGKEPDNLSGKLTEIELKEIAMEINSEYNLAMRMLAAGEENEAMKIAEEYGEKE